MRSRVRIAGLLVAMLLPMAVAAPARADQAYQRVAGAFGQAGGHLDPCAFRTAQLEAALRGIPPALRSTVPALRSAIETAITARKHGECKGVRPEERSTGGAAAPGAVPPVTTAPPAATQPATTPAPATAAPPTATPTTTPAPAATAPAQPAAARAGGVDRHTALVVALIAIGALLLTALALWATARSRGWDPAWLARTRHAWGEAGFRTTSTWAEFTDWLRLGR